MPANPHFVTRVLQIMDEWLDLPQSTYKPAVYRFALRLPPEELLDALEIAHAKIPQGGMGAFKYFCGVCHGKIYERKIRLSWN
jgi:hypothetical protein